MTQTPQAASMALATMPQYEVSDSDRERLKVISAAWDAYTGNLPKPLKSTPDGIDPNVMTNRCVEIVDRGVDFLFGKEIEISVEEGAPAEAQDFLNDVWGRKEQRIPLLQKLAMNGAIAGQAFLRIVPNADNTQFRLIVVDPSIVFVQTAPQDVETVLLYCIEYSLMEKDSKGKPVQVFYHEEISRVDPDGNASKSMPDDDDTWLISHWTKVGERGAWQSSGEPYTWPYQFAPIFSCQNLPMPNSFWGTPDITPDIIGVNKSLNLVQSCINLVQLLYGQPILYSTGMGQQDIAMKPGYIIGIGSPDGKINSVNIVSDVANALAFAANLRSDIDELSSVPGVATGRIDVMPRGISGVAIELLFMPLIKKTDKRRCTYGELLIDVSKALLQIKGFSQDIDISLPWASSLPDDDLTTVQASIMKQTIGISNFTLQRELGYDPEEEEALADNEAAKKLTAFSQGQGMPPPMQPEAQPANNPFLGGN